MRELVVQRERHRAIPLPSGLALGHTLGIEAHAVHLGRLALRGATVVLQALTDGNGSFPQGVVVHGPSRSRAVDVTNVVVCQAVEAAKPRSVPQDGVQALPLKQRLLLHEVGVRLRALLSQSAGPRIDETFGDVDGEQPVRNDAKLLEHLRLLHSQREVVEDPTATHDVRRGDALAQHLDDHLVRDRATLPQQAPKLAGQRGAHGAEGADLREDLRHGQVHRAGLLRQRTGQCGLA
mmetsp:Transcript_56647/g.184298  ORF Transcript_56647/g.184298 Transcript_56647/m.184298 type:complete len:236 (+) Transcript_56647:859-1566(+)